MTRLFDCSLRLLVRPQGLPGGLLHVLFHHGERFLDLLDVVRSTRATLALHADAKTMRTRHQGTARRTAGVHDRTHGENGSDSDSDDNDASHRGGARAGLWSGDINSDAAVPIITHGCLPGVHHRFSASTTLRVPHMVLESSIKHKWMTQTTAPIAPVGTACTHIRARTNDVQTSAMLRPPCT